MACYHLNEKITSRGNGNSITEVAAYMSGEKLRDSYTGRIYDYSYREDVLFKGILLPEKAPPEFLDRQALMDAVNSSEIRSDAQLARIVEIALPNEFPFDRQLALVKEFVEENFIKRGLCADIAIHRGRLDKSRKPVGIEPVQKRSDNPHAHIIIPFRTVGEDGFSRNKTQTRFMNSRKYLIELREAWAALQNREFERNGLDIRVSHESLRVQGIDREPTIHIGAAAIALELKGEQTWQGDKYRGIKERNRERERDKERQRDRERERDRERIWDRER